MAEELTPLACKPYMRVAQGGPAAVAGSAKINPISLLQPGDSMAPGLASSLPRLTWNMR